MLAIMPSRFVKMSLCQVCVRVESDHSQDKEKPMAVRTANIMAARGTHRSWESKYVIRAVANIYQPSLML